MLRNSVSWFSCSWSAAICAVILAFAPAHQATAQETQPQPGHEIIRSIPPAGAKTHAVAPGDRFRAGWFKTWIYGSGYRDLWTTPIEAQVLDLDSVGGGLTPLRIGGMGQSITLHFMGQDGNRYTVRSMDKDPTKQLSAELKNTAVEGFLQDQISSHFPAGALVADALMDATGIIHAPHTVVVIPDDPRLGEFRQNFAGMLGTLQVVPSEGPDKSPGFAGSCNIKGSETLWEDLEKGPCNRINSRAFLKARLMDFLLNDKDRHAGQWKWARFPDGDCFTWFPIPEDRDQAFVNFNGLAMAIVRRAVPKQIKFQDKYPNLIGLSMNGWELDREILAELDKPVWDSVVTAFQSELPDSVIDNAVRKLPLSYYEMKGEFLSQALKSRRENLPEFVDRYYRLINRQVEIQATDKDEYIELEHLPGGDLSVRMGRSGDPGAGDANLYFQRTFHPHETKEVRVYMRGGDDRVEVLGGKAKIGVRVDGGGGDDSLANASSAGSGKTRFYDHRGENSFVKGRGAKIDEHSYNRPPGTSMGPAHAKYTLDWGKQQFSYPVISGGPDLGLYMGAIVGIRKFGYRKDPFSSRHMISLGLATDGPKPFIGYTGTFRDIWHGLDGKLHMEYSGIKVIRFHGFGNETVLTESSSFYKVEQNEFVLSPGLEFRSGKNRGDKDGGGKEVLRSTITTHIGPTIRYSDTPLDENTERFIGTLVPSPYGAGDFGQVGLSCSFKYDSRDNPGFTSKGLMFEVSSAVYPEAWDVESTFGNVDGEASAHVTAHIPTEPTLSLRAGGKKVWGTYPFHEAAFLGGPANLRGFWKDRFAGDARVYGNAQLRFKVTRIKIVVPGALGFFGAADVGRVFFDGDPDNVDKWHTGTGGGVWFSFLQQAQTFSIALMNGDDLTGVYLNAGFMF